MYEYYMRLADEVRARVVSRRYLYSPERLAAESPMQTARTLDMVGYPDQRQIVPAPFSNARTQRLRDKEDAKNIIDRMRAQRLLGRPARPPP
jgi:hypothetical protein